MMSLYIFANQVLEFVALICVIACCMKYLKSR